MNLKAFQEIWAASGLNQACDCRHKSAEEIYQAYEWSFATERAGVVALQGVGWPLLIEDRRLAAAGGEYQRERWAVAQLMESQPAIEYREAMIVWGKARQVYDYAIALEAELLMAARWAMARDIDRTIAFLGAAFLLEVDHGEPAASIELAERLLCIKKQGRLW